MVRTKGQGAGVNPRSLAVLEQHSGVTPADLLDGMTEHVPLRDIWVKPPRKEKPKYKDQPTEFFERKKGRCPVCFMKRSCSGTCSCE